MGMAAVNPFPFEMPNDFCMALGIEIAIFVFWEIQK